MADFTEFQQSATAFVDWDSFTEQSYGAAVSNALSDAECLPLSLEFEERFANPLTGMIEGTSEYND